MSVFLNAPDDTHTRPIARKPIVAHKRSERTEDMTMRIKTLAALTIAAPAMAFSAVPASAALIETQSATDIPAYAPLETSVNAEYDRERRWDRRRDRRDDRYYGGYGGQQRYYGEPVHRSTRVWRGDDNRYYCRKENGTTGLLIGAGVGALIGNEVAGRGDRTLGAILGAAGGALLGREIDRSNARCR
jgi:hypothetical protein